MAAATQTNLGPITAVPFVIHQVDLSSLTSGQTENVSYATPVAQCALRAPPMLVTMQVVTPPATGEQVTFARVLSSDSAANSTVAVKVVGEVAGDLTDCVVRISIWFLDQARQDGQSINQDNNT